MTDAGAMLNCKVIGVPNIQELEDEFAKNASIAVDFHHLHVRATSF